VQQLTRFQLTCSVAWFVCSSRACKIWIIHCWFPTKVCTAKLFPKLTLYANIQINFGELKVKVSSRKYKQLAINGTGVFSFCNLLYNKHICGIFVHLTIRVYRRMVGKDNQKYGSQYRYRHRRYFKLLNCSIAITITIVFRPVSVLNIADFF